MPLCVSPGWPRSWACLLLLPPLLSTHSPLPCGFPKALRSVTGGTRTPAAPPRTAGQICRATRPVIGRWRSALRLAGVRPGCPSERSHPSAAQSPPSVTPARLEGGGRRRGDCRRRNLLAGASPGTSRRVLPLAFQEASAQMLYTTTDDVSFLVSFLYTHTHTQ